MEASPVTTADVLPSAVVLEAGFCAFILPDLANILRMASALLLQAGSGQSVMRAFLEHDEPLGTWRWTLHSEHRSGELGILLLVFSTLLTKYTSTCSSVHVDMTYVSILLTPWILT